MAQTTGAKIMALELQVSLLREDVKDLLKIFETILEADQSTSTALQIAKIMTHTMQEAIEARP